MAVTLENVVEALLEERLVEPKTSGSPSTPEEAASVFHSIASALFFVPKTALSFEMFAKNGLTKAVAAELAAIALVEADVTDLSNPRYAMGPSDDLVRARGALLLLESLPNLVSDSPALRTYDNATGLALTQFANNVRSGGTLIRTAEEAETALMADLEALRTAHEQVLDRLYKLAVGIDNFVRAPLQAVVASLAISRIRDDLESVLRAVEADDGASARESVLKLLAGRSVLQVLSTAPALLGTLLPPDMTAESSNPATVSAETGPLTLPLNPQISIAVNGGAPASYAFFIGEAALLISGSISFPVTIPTGQDLYLALDSGTVSVPMGGTYNTGGELAARLNGANISGLGATQFASDPSRWLIYSTASQSIEVAPLQYVDESGVGVLRNLSVHDQVGFELGQAGTRQLPLAPAVDAINLLFPDVEAEWSGDWLTISTRSTAPGAALEVVMPGLVASASASSNTLTLSAPTEELQAGDEIEFAGATARVVNAIGSSVVLDQALPTARASVRATSALVISHLVLRRAVQGFLKPWLASSYAKDLTAVDRAIAPLSGDRSGARRGTALRELASLREWIQELATVLAGVEWDPSAARREMGLANAIVETLRERKYDRAVGALLQGDIASLIGMDGDVASYAGKLLTSVEAYAQTRLTIYGSGGATYSTGRAE